MSGTSIHTEHAKIGTRAQWCQILMSPSSPPAIEHICMLIIVDVLPPFNTLSQSHLLQYIFNVNTFMKLQTPSRKRIEFPRG